MTKKQNVEIFYQEFRDFKDDLKADLTEIKENTKKTNGCVAKAMLDIAILSKQEETCPARVNYSDDKKETKEWIMWIPSAIAVIISIVSLIN